MKYAILLSALSISLVSAYFSIIGLTTMFPGVFWSIVIMGGVLEVGKLISASWLHHNWSIAPRSLKIYLTSAVVVLIFITSMGIFGFLSKSHIQHQKGSQEIKILVSQIDNKILREQEYIERQREYIKSLDSRLQNASDKDVYNIELEQKKIDDLYKTLQNNINIDNDQIQRLNSRLKDLDAQVELLNASTGGLFSNKAKKLRDLEAKQKLERDSIADQISNAENRINELRQSTEKEASEIRSRITSYQDKEIVIDDTSSKKEEFNNNIKSSYEKIEQLENEKFQQENSQLELEAEVGPVKYVAELLEDFGTSKIDLSSAVRIIIVILVFVFDPLAVAMLLAANLNFRKGRTYPVLSEHLKKK